MMVSAEIGMVKNEQNTLTVAVIHPPVQLIPAHREMSLFKSLH